MVALALLALPAVAFGQGVECEVCTHQVSVYMGEGGLVAKATDADGEVTWVTECNGVSQWGKLTPNDDGMVAMLFNMDNGRDCASPGKDDKLEIGPVDDGGWYWITDDMNSAVGGLVNKKVYEALKDMTTDPTSAGSAVTMTKGAGAVYLKETASGRVGILPNILPEVPEAPVALCGYETGGTSKAPTYSVRGTNCRLGTGAVKIVAKGPRDVYDNTRKDVDSGVDLVRPSLSNTSITVDFALLGDGGYLPDGTPAGHYSDSSSTPRLGTVFDSPLEATYTATTTTAAASPTTVPATENDHGLNLTDAQLVITPKDTYCSADNNYTAVVKVYADVSDTQAKQIVPDIVDTVDSDADKTVDKAGVFRVNVVCPSTSAAPNPGQELVPDNPFPTDR